MGRGMPTAGATRRCRNRPTEERETHVMYCQRCADLLAAYRRSVNLHTTALRKSLGVPGDDEEVERLSLKCRETNEVLMAHWRQKHKNSGSSPKTP